MTKRTKGNWNTPIVVFYIFIGALIFFFITIALKIAISPVCSTDAQHICVVDSGSVIGLVTTVFGVAGTLLAFLGTFAVAYWWGTLNERVDARIEALTSSLIEERVREQDEKFQALITSNIQVFNTQVSQLKSSLQATERQFIASITQFDPWIIDGWASDLCEANISFEIAPNMVRSYLKIVDLYIFPPVPNKLATLRLAPDDADLLCWEKALEWQQKVIRQGRQGYIDAVKSEIDKRKPLFDEYLKTRNKL